MARSIFLKFNQIKKNGKKRNGRQGQQTGVATFRGDGEFLMKIRRFIPDFI
jgi:hypothetical protein